MTRLIPCLVLAAGSLAPRAAAADPAEPFRVERVTSFQGPADRYYMQTRGAVIPGPTPRVLVLTQEIEKAGAHGFRDVFAFETRDLGRTWAGPTRVEGLRRAKRPDGYEVVIGDLCPQWHARTGVVLATGKTFNFAGGTKEDRGRERVSYTVYSPGADAWSGLKTVDLPAADHQGKPFSQPNAGCCQRVDLPNGDILLPIRYCRAAGELNYTSVVARCAFDGTTLKYVAHGSELGLPRGRGLYEPSLVACGGKFYLTLRADASAYVARSADGLTYDPPVEWRFDDGAPLGSSNTQQRWVARGADLYLVYTRTGANNDHVFRHRAPLFIARVDRDKLRVVRATERVLVPENQADLGNFGVLDVGPRETWVIASEQLAGTRRKDEPNETWVAKVRWADPVGAAAPWAGQKVLARTAGATLTDAGTDGKPVTRPVRHLVYTVVAEDGDRVRVNYPGQEGWAARADWVRLSDALDYFGGRVTADPRDAFAWSRRGVAHRYAGRPDLALKDLEEAVRLAPKDADVVGIRGMMWWANKDYGRAIADYTAAVRLDPGYAVGFRNRGLAWHAKGDFNKALADYTASARVAPHYAPAFHDRAATWRARGEPRKALADLTAAVRLDPRYAAAAADLARLLATCADGTVRDGKRALEVAMRANESTGGNDPSVLDARAAACAEVGEYDRAVEYQKKALADKGYEAAAGAKARERLRAFEQRKPWRE